jgi:hypothetical protein
MIKDIKRTSRPEIIQPPRKKPEMSNQIHTYATISQQHQKTFQGEPGTRKKTMSNEESSNREKKMEEEKRANHPKQKKTKKKKQKKTTENRRSSSDDQCPNPNCVVSKQ